MEKVDGEDVAIRYQLYFTAGYEQQAKQLLANGLTAFLERNDLAWRTKSCNIAII